MNITIAGDFVINKDVSSVNITDKKILNLYTHSDFNIVNIEAPITNLEHHKILKTGPNLKMSPKYFNFFNSILNLNVATLANNHITDFGQNGFEETIKFLESNEIKYVGAGNNLLEASKVLYLEKNDTKVSIINVCESEWTIAGSTTGGANPLDIVDVLTQIKKAKLNSDFVILVIHGGNEYYHFPSPNRVKLYRFFAENGVDIIVSHHTHCISGYEIWNDIPIFYGLGNFFFSTNLVKNQNWYEGIVLELNFNKNSPIDFNIHYTSFLNDNLVLLNEVESVKNKTLINYLNNIISSEDELLNQWLNFVKSKEIEYLRNVSPVATINNRFLKSFLMKTKLYKLFMNESYIKETLNRIRCESHLEVMRTLYVKLLNDV